MARRAALAAAVGACLWGRRPLLAITPDTWRASASAQMGYFTANWENINFSGNPQPPAPGDYLWVNNGGAPFHFEQPGEFLVLSSTSSAGQYLEISNGTFALSEIGNAGGPGFGMTVDAGGYFEADGSGIVNIAGPIIVGDSAGTSGSLAQFWNGATIHAGINAGTTQSIIVGNSGSGEVDQIGAAVTVPNLVLGNTAGGAGGYTLYSGNLNATASTTLGANAANTLQILGGVFTTPSLIQNGGSTVLGGGTTTITSLQLNSGTFTVAFNPATTPLPNFYFGGNYTINSTARTTSPVILSAGNVLLAGGTFNLSGAASVSANSLIVNGGTFNQSAGSLTTSSADFSSAGGFLFTGGTMTINGGALKPQLSAIVWNNGAGSTLFANNAWMISGMSGGTSPTLILKSGAASTTGNGLIVGNSGGGGAVTITDAGSTVSSASGLALGIGLGGDNTTGHFIPGSGTLNLANGASVAAGQVVIGLGGGQGNMLVSGGGTTLNSTHIFAGSGQFLPSGSPAIGGSGTMTISSGAHVTASFIDVGNSGAQGSITVTDSGSTLTSTSQLIVGESSTANTGALNVQSGGSLITSGFVGIGATGGVGALSILGGNSSWTDSAGINIGDAPAGSAGTLTVGGGATVTTPSLNILSAASVVNLGAGGTLNTGTLSNTVNPAAFSWTGGALNITDSGLTIGSPGPLGPSLTVRSNQTLTTAGNLVVAGNGVLNVKGGAVTAPVLLSSGTFTQTAGSITVTAAVNNGSMQLTGGTNSFGLLSGTGSFSIGNALGGAAVSAGLTTLSQSTLQIAGTGQLGLSGAGSSNSVSLLQIQNGGLLDLTTSALTLNYGSAASPNAQIRSYISSAYNVSAAVPWTGTTGITSSAAAADSAHHTLAFADGADGVVTNLPAGISSAIPSGGTLPAGSELVTYALPGDANLDGKVDFSDFIVLSNHFGVTDANWDHGNFNYDPAVDFSDFIVLSNNFGAGTSTGGAAGATAVQLAQYNAMAASLGISQTQINRWDARIESLPEPTSTALLAMGAISLLARRRRAE